MDQKPPKDLIGYDQITKRAMRSIVREALLFAAREGLPGGHHFYIGFKTNRSDISLSDRLRERYPKKMTIVLQHQFEELTVGESEFSVILSFNDIRETVSVSFAAITSFADPEVQFGLHLAESDDNKDDSKNNNYDEQTPEEQGEQSRIVSLDSFRKKRAPNQDQ
ncbi:MAG: ClpXP protease specificity-enhancing factor SspB [Parvularculales bacterium]